MALLCSYFVFCGHFYFKKTGPNNSKAVFWLSNRGSVGRRGQQYSPIDQQSGQHQQEKLQPLGPQSLSQQLAPQPLGPQFCWHPPLPQAL